MLVFITTIFGKQTYAVAAFSFQRKFRLKFVRVYLNALCLIDDRYS